MTSQELKTIRAKLGLSQAALAARLGVQRNTVVRWEMGLHPIPEMATKFLTLISAPVTSDE
jgi:DNA-binding transcriptional regulator YiaG